MRDWSPVTQDEVTHLESLLERGYDGFYAAVSYVRRHPYLILPCGYDEVRIAPLASRINTTSVGRLNITVPEDMRHATFPDDQDLSPQGRQANDWLELCYCLNCRAIDTGVWYEAFKPNPIGAFFPSPSQPDLPLLLDPRGGQLDDPERWRYLDLRLIARWCRKALETPSSFGAVILPNLWIPPETHPRIELVDTTKDLLSRLKANELSLKDVTWRQLEEIVAELLRGRGMEVTVTPPASDGGRDVIVKGELIPGEPVVLAIEVKHREVVSLDEVRSRLYANKEFPAVLFATSGRFSAGVIREKKKPENFLRMFLKDGAALKQWIEEYGSG